ncbi:hypothetical protein ACFVT6_19955 [Streptomyces sp. NPDC058049]|uniref:hypothetical protein n=1 Tax=Streptomyces sp. NPDC058049 TaxID=3346314 RepID=UPI0036F0615B
MTTRPFTAAAADGSPAPGLIGIGLALVPTFAFAREDQARKAVAGCPAAAS